MAVAEVINGIIDLINNNIIAKTDLMADAIFGDEIIEVENSFHFENGQEIVLIDYGYNDSSSPHYQIFEYARVKEVIDTRHIRLYEPIQDTGTGWLVSNRAFIQKTIGHSPLYEDRVYYGDRAVIPSEDMSITIEPLSMSNDWLYIGGGLSEEYRVSIMIYGKDIQTEEGLQILNKYADAVYRLLISDLHPDINNYDTPILHDVSAGSDQVIIKDTEKNREEFVVGPIPYVFRTNYDIQDNLKTEQGRQITAISPVSHVPGGEMTVTVDRPFAESYFTSEYAAFIRHGLYFYDSRVDSIDYGEVQKGSAMLRAARLSWFGKIIHEEQFPQKSKGIPYFPEEESSSESS